MHGPQCATILIVSAKIGCTFTILALCRILYQAINYQLAFWHRAGYLPRSWFRYVMANLLGRSIDCASGSRYRRFEHRRS